MPRRILCEPTPLGGIGTSRWAHDIAAKRCRDGDLRAVGRLFRIELQDLSAGLGAQTVLNGTLQPGAAREGQARERRLARREWVAPQVIATQFDEMEGVEEDARVVVPIPDAVEARDPGITARYRLAVDDAGARGQLGQRLDDQREAVCQIMCARSPENRRA